MYSLIKKLSGIGPTSTDILKDESGHSITEKEKIETGKSFPELAEYPLSQWRPHSPNCRATILRFFGPPSYDDIHKLKTTKREVLTAFPELFRRGAPSVCQPLQELLALIWLRQKISDDWNIAVIIPCYKKGDKNAPTTVESA